MTNQTTAERKRLYAETMALGPPPYMTIDKGALAKLLEDLQSAQAEAKALTEHMALHDRACCNELTGAQDD